MCGTNWRPSFQLSSAVGRLNLTGSATQVADLMWRSLAPCISSAETQALAERRGLQRSERYGVPHWWLRHGLHNTVASHSFEGGS
jgi:hypothetical protein